MLRVAINYDHTTSLRVERFDYRLESTLPGLHKTTKYSVPDLQCDLVRIDGNFLGKGLDPDGDCIGLAEASLFIAHEERCLADSSFSNHDHFEAGLGLGADSCGRTSVHAANYLK